MAEGLIPVLLGFAEPGSPGSAKPGGQFGQAGHVPLQQRSQLAKPGIAWAALGVDPRWAGMETSDCAAALEPGIYHNQGASERDRYIAGASNRGETALLISTIGDVNGTRRNPLSVYDASVSLSLESGSIDGRRLPAGAAVSLADNLNRADRDLALRLKNRPPGAWWTLHLGSSRWTSGAGEPLGVTGPDGNLTALLVDGLHDQVVAVWTSPQVDLRWYIIPDQTDWPTVIDWLVQQALPAYVPGALRRARSERHVDADLLTAGETVAIKALADLEEQYARDKAALEHQLHSATKEATAVRDGLLHGTGGDLVDAVRDVLTAAGFEVHDLDAELGGTKLADLLAAQGNSRCLIEVKSASGNASEGLVGDLQRHISTWPALQPAQPPVTHAALIVNHQCRQPPRERLGSVYTRAEFVSALSFPVLSAVQLFDWWRASDWPAIRNALLPSRPQDPPDRTTASGQQPHSVPTGKPGRTRLLSWRSKSGNLYSRSVEHPPAQDGSRHLTAAGHTKGQP